jgi:hypothetical protein
MIYGIDYGCRRVAVSGPDLARAALILPDPKTGTHRLTGPHEVFLVGGFIAATVPQDAAIYIEQPVARHGARVNTGTAIRLSMTVGAVFARHAGPGYVVDQATWKAALLGNGHASKDEIATWLWSESPGDAEACDGDQDLIDATCIRIYGELVAAGRLEEPRKLPRRR